MAIESRMYDKYKNEIRDELNKDFGFKSIMQVPKIEKIVINMGLGKATGDKSVVTDGIAELNKITGQYSNATIAKQSNSVFKLREGMPIGVKVTLRGQNMWDFLDKLISISLPRIRDFRGVKHTSFDGNGNYSLGINEFIIFPEIDLDKVKVMKGMDITIVTSTNDNKVAYALLEKLGMPFTKKRGEN